MSTTHSPQRVSISTGARLHFGLLANRPESGREFGGIGLMISEPNFRLSVARSDGSDRFDISIENAGVLWEAARRAGRFLEGYRERCADAPRAVQIEIESAIPGHQGLGSGTQLGLAIAKALALLTGTDASAPELARRVGRGKRSAIGIWGFDHGGFLVDGGKLPSDDIGVLVGRFDVPQEWRFVLVSPLAQAGLSGAEELAAFKTLSPMSESITQRLCQLVLTNVLPALREAAFEGFAASLFEYGRVVGEYFAPAQGGIFAAPLMSRLSEALHQLGHARPVQTSWGPTCAIPCRSLDEAAVVQAAIVREVAAAVVETRIVTAMPHGATVQSE